MRIKPGVLIIFSLLLACAFNCSNGEMKPTTPENLLSAFNAAGQSNDEAKAETLCTKKFWNAKRDSGKRFFKQLSKKKFEMKKNDVQTKGARAVVTADIIRDGKVVDQVYTYAISQNDLWLIDGMDENENHTDHYLEGRLPGRFHPSDYPGNDELNALGAKLVEIAGRLKEAVADVEQQESLLKGVFTGDAAKIYSELRLLREAGDLKLKVVSTHMIDSIGRGAIAIYDDTEKEKVFIYVAKTPEGWKLTACYTGWLSAESILR